MSDSPPRRSWGGLTVPLAALGLAATAAWLAGPDTPDRRQAVVFAAVTSLIGTALAGAVALWRPATAAGRAALPLAAMALRLAPALASLAWLQAGGARLRAAGAGEVLVFLYLAALGADLARIIIGERNFRRRPRDCDGV